MRSRTNYKVLLSTVCVFPVNDLRLNKIFQENLEFT